MSATSTRLRWALGIAVVVHLLLALWLFAGSHRRELAVAARRLGLGEQVLLPSTVQVAAPETALPSLKASSAEGSGALAEAERKSLQLAAAQAAAAVPPPIAPLQAIASVAAPSAPALTSPLRKPPLARAALPGVVLALKPIARAALPSAGVVPKRKAERLPQARSPAPLVAARPPPAKPKVVAKATGIAKAPVAAKLPPVASKAVVPSKSAAASSPVKTKPKPKPQPKAKPPLVTRASASPPVSAPRPRVLPVSGAQFFTAQEEVYQLPSGRLSMRLGNPPPRPLLPAAASGSGLAVEAEDAAPLLAARPLLPPPAPTPVEAPEPPARPAFELPRLNAVTAAPPKPPVPSIAAISEAPAGNGSFPPITIYQAPEIPGVAAPEPEVRAAPRVPVAAPVGARTAFFQEVTTQLKASNAQTLADALRVGQKLTVRMKFALRRDGKLVRIAAAAKTPDWAVVEAAKVVRAAAPFPPMPADLAGKTVELSFPVEIYAP